MVADPIWLPRPFTDRLEAAIDGLLREEADGWRSVDQRAAEPIELLRSFVGAGGKRLRPTIAYWAFVGAGGDPCDDRLLHLGCALELLHAFALVHDDVMDDSDSRRGLPTVHAAVADRHRGADWAGPSDHYGRAAAILVGDLAHAYADDLLRQAAPELADVWQELRIEVNLGQFLDLAAAAQRDRAATTAHTIARYKSGRYSVEHPLRLGARLAGRPDLADALLGYGEPVGRAFQLRDDVLGCFGDPALTGKPVGSDLREGKATLLIAEAFARAAPADAERLRVAMGAADPDAAVVLALIESSGARVAVDAQIAALVDEALVALAAVPIPTTARDALAGLARFVATRDR
jgi:geranylgeranyl diphosphate synthase, type I